MAKRRALWILCDVVDNFGDAGVCWRLARELAAHSTFEPTLIIDRPDTLAALEPRLAPSIGAEAFAPIDGVRVLARSSIESTPVAPLPSVIVSAFGSEPPPWLRTRLAGGPRVPLWIQLEYLSAEDWIEGCHGLVSVKPSDAAREHFLYPGFTEATAGLLREPDLETRRRAFVDSGGPQAFLGALGALPGANQRVFSLFCYPSAPLADWFDTLAGGPGETLVCVAGGSAAETLRARLGRALEPGERQRLGHVEFIRLPMLSQDDYDRLLWSCAFNAVRGEDSWIRAHWARTPFVWQAYPQAGDIHLVKLEAFLGRMGAGLHTDRAADQAVIDAMMRAWNDPSGRSLRAAWRAFDTRLESLGERYRAWADQLARQTGLAERLVRYCFDRLE